MWVRWELGSRSIKVNPNISVKQAANMSINSATAYLLLTKFTELKPGDCIIQNGATSAVGFEIMQISKIMGVTSGKVLHFLIIFFLVNIFRTRGSSEETGATRKVLQDYGPGERLN